MRGWGVVYLWVDNEDTSLASKFCQMETFGAW